MRIIRRHVFEYQISQNGAVLVETFKGAVYFYPAIDILVYKNIIFCTGGIVALEFIRDITKGLKL